MKVLFLLPAIIAAPFLAVSQLVISDVPVGAANNTQIVIQTSGNITNNSSFDFASTQLRLALNGTNQILAGTISPTSMQISGGGTKTVNGNLTIKQQIDFGDGILKTGTGKILYNGNSDGVNAHDNSFVEGMFFANTNGSLTFPIGASGIGYSPAFVEVNGKEIGIAVVSGNAGLTLPGGDEELTEIYDGVYWTIQANDLAANRSKIQLSLDAVVPGFFNDLAPVVVEADQTGGAAFNLGSFSVSNSSVTSAQAFKKPIVAIGGSTKVEIRIHDLITPFTIKNNDYLHIENIDKFPVNTVTLLDRWGVVIKEWKNFTNYDDEDNPNQDAFDFTTLTPGNYICTVEYSKEGQAKARKAQMVTVLKTKL